MINFLRNAKDPVLMLLVAGGFLVLALVWGLPVFLVTGDGTFLFFFILCVAAYLAMAGIVSLWSF